MKSSFLLVLFLLPLALVPAEVYGAPNMETLGNIPLAFTLNQGQTDPLVRFTGQGGGTSLFFTRQGITFTMTRPAQDPPGAQKAASDTPEPVQREGLAIQRTFLGANASPEITGEERLAWNNNFFYGNSPAGWQTDVPNYSRIRVLNLYPGIDAVCYGKDGTIKYDFIVHPGADPKVIAWKYDLGETEGSVLSLREDGVLTIRTPFGEMLEEKPYCYQMVNGKETEVKAGYRIDGNGDVCAFMLGEYDASYPLVIDPVLVYSTYIWGYSIPGATRHNIAYQTEFGQYLHDTAIAVSVDDSGCAHVAGWTQSPSFTSSPGAYVFGSSKQLFVVKFSPDGRSLLYAACVGGSGVYNNPSDMALDGEGSVYVIGQTTSGDFPTTSVALDRIHNGDRDGFVFKLSAAGNELIYSTYFGGSLIDMAQSIALDSKKNAYITGYTHSPDFPVTPGAYDTSHNGGREWEAPMGQDAFLLKINPQGSTLVYSTFIGGSSSIESGFGVAVDQFECAYVAGSAISKDFPVTHTAFGVFHGYQEAFITKFNPLGSELVYSTLIGSDYAAIAYSIQVNSAGEAFVAGYTFPGFPVTPGAYDTSYNYGPDGEFNDLFTLRLSASGEQLVYSTYIGGRNYDCFGYPCDIALDAKDTLYLTSYTRSIDFPILGSGSTPPSNWLNHNINETVLCVLSPTGDLEFSTTVGGELHGDIGMGIAVDNKGGVYIAGISYDSGMEVLERIHFPTTPGSYLPTDPGWLVSSFLVKFSFASDQREYTLKEAAESGFINPYSYTWNGQEYIPIRYSDDTPISPWSGFWVFPYQSMDMLIPRPEQYTDYVTKKTAQYTVEPNRYYLFGVPLANYYAKPEYYLNLNGELGIIEQDWQLARWNWEYSGGYAFYDGDYENFPSLLHGRGFWLYHVNPNPVTVNLEGYTASLAGGYYPLKVAVNENGQPTYHMLANPFQYNIKWKDFRIRVPMSAGHPYAKPARIALENTRSWQIGLGVQSLDGRARDTHNRAGVILTSGAESRLLNAAELLPPGDFIKLALKDPSNSGRETLAYDYREAGRPEYTWEIELTTTFPAIDARLSLSGLAQVPKEYTLTLTDQSHKPYPAVYNLSEDLTIPATLSSAAPRKFILTATAKPTVVEQEQPAAFGISGISPNPFNPSTSITFGLEQAGNVLVKVYSLTGQLTDTLVDTRLSAGSHTVTWNPHGLASGVYFITVESNGIRDSRKVTLMK
ncbi:MAG: DUF7948 domain-containing protein [Candidatus Latescibacterota bacterium]